MNAVVANLTWAGFAVMLVVGVVHRAHVGEDGAATVVRSESVDDHVGVTQPSREVQLGGARAGRIARIQVEPGAEVEEGQLLFELENDVERLDYERLRLGASAGGAIALATARLEKARLEADRIAELSDRDIASGAREDEAVADRRIAEAELTRAREQQALLALERDQAQARFELLRSRSPFHGRVEQVFHDVGESVDHLDPVLSLVALRPLHVEFPCPVEERDQWREGSVAEVSDGGTGSTGRAKVVFCGRQVEVASQTVTVRLVLPNQDGAWLSGRRVHVRRIESKEGK